MHVRPFGQADLMKTPRHYLNALTLLWRTWRLVERRGKLITLNYVNGADQILLEHANQLLKEFPEEPLIGVEMGIAFGGGPELAVKDFEKALQLNPKSAEAKMWLGIALRKLNRNADARLALAKSLELNPNRMWAKQQLEKTPAN